MHRRRWPKQDSEVFKGVAILGSIKGVGVKKAREAIGAAGDVDGLEEVREDLSDVFDVVGGGACDGREVRCGVSEEGFCIPTRSHGILG